MIADPDDTASFSVPAAVRAPVGVTLDPGVVRRVRRCAVALAIGTALILVDLDVAAGGVQVDLAPDLLGGVFVVAGTIAASAVASVSGPVRAGRIAVLLAILQLPLLLVDDVPSLLSTTSLAARAEQLSWIQSTIAAFGTAVVATILSRGHDALGQLGRRRRWMHTRRAALLVAIVNLPVAFVVDAVGEDPSGPLSWVVGLASVVLAIATLLLLILLARSLAASANVELQVGWGEA